MAKHPYSSVIEMAETLLGCLETISKSCPDESTKRFALQVLTSAKPSIAVAKAMAPLITSEKAA